MRRAQLLIRKFAVFTCVSFFFTDASHGSLARSFSRPPTFLEEPFYTLYIPSLIITIYIISVEECIVNKEKGR